MKLNPMEKKRLLKKRAKRELEAVGYGLKEKQNGNFLVVNGETEVPFVECENIEQVGRIFGLWGEDTDDSVLTYAKLIKQQAGKPIIIPDRDASGKDTPETAAIREKIHKTPPRYTRPKEPKVSEHDKHKFHWTY